MTTRSTQDSCALVIRAAQELFAERGFDRVTIREIALRADMSPAMVMKLVGSKKELFYRAATIEPPEPPDVELEALGEELVRRLVDRYEAAAIEHLLRALVLRLSAPDPDSVVVRFVTGYVDPLTDRLGGDEVARLHAEMVVSALLGVAAGLRLFGLEQLTRDRERVVRVYGGSVQALIDAARP